MKATKTTLNMARVAASIVAATMTCFAIIIAPIANAQPPPFAWAKRIASTVNPDDELSIGLALDSAANLYVTGWFDGTNDFGGVMLTNNTGGGQDIFVGKYSSAGALQWARRAGGNTADRDGGRGIGSDNAGNIYVTGEFLGAAGFDGFTLSAPVNKEFFLAKYDNAGAVQWVRQSVGGRSSGVYGTGLAVDSVGNSYAVGFADNGATITFGTNNLLRNDTGYSTFLVKYDNTGTVQWAQLVGGPGHTYSTSVAIDTSGYVYVAGSFSMSMSIGATNFTSAGAKDGFVAKLNNAGVLQWARQMGGPSDDAGLGSAAVDATGNVYVVGGFGNTNGDIISFGSGITLTNVGGGLPGAGVGDAFLAKYNSAGAVQWAQRAGGTNMDAYTSVSTDAQGNIYVGGGAGGTGMPGSFNAVVAKYDTNGAVQWTQSSTGTNSALVFGGPLLDSATNCYIAGWFQTNAVFGTNTLTGKGYWDFFLAKIGTNALPVTDYTYITNNGTITITGYTGPGGAITIPSTINGLTVTSIATNAFQNNINVISVTIPSSVTSIGSYAFYSSAGLTNVGIPSSVTNIGDFAFGSCSDLMAITVDALNPSYTSGVGVLFNKSQTTLIQYPGGKVGGFTIPTGVTSIMYFAFARCTSLTGVVIPATVTSIGNGAFYLCSSLTSVVIPPGVTDIAGSLFNSCANLTSVKIPATVTSIGVAAFYQCASLTNISIPNSVTNIGNVAFYNCANLNGIYFGGNAPSLGGSDVFTGDANAIAYYLPGTTNWNQWVSPPPAVLWNPTMPTTNSSFGIKTNRFGFTIVGTTDIPIVVEAATNLTGSAWASLQNTTLTNGSVYFSDPQWTNYPRRFYRIRSP